MESLINKVTGFQPCSFSKKKLQLRHFPLNIAKKNQTELAKIIAAQDGKAELAKIIVAQDGTGSLFFKDAG